MDGPADGIVTGLARVRERPIAIASYDYTVMAGSQGNVNNTKISRILQIAEERSLPVVIFQFALSPYKDWQKLAWTGALIITLAVLALSIVARILTAQRKSS